MKIMRILGVAVLAATVAGCTLSERQFVEYRAVFNKHPELRAKYHTICVKEIKRYGLKDGKQIAFVDRETPTRGKEMTVLEQLFGNLGRFNNSVGSGGRGR